MPVLALAKRYAGHSVLLSSRIAISNQQITRSGVSFYPLTINPRRLWTILFSVVECVVRLYRLKPKVVVASGGMVCVPVLIAARVLRIPYVLLEQNVVPGRVTRWFASGAKRVFLGLPVADPAFSSAKCVGNPLFERDDSTGLVARLQTELGDKRVVLVMGGSQGAQAINDWIRAQYDWFSTLNWALVHLTGASYYAANFSDQEATFYRTPSGSVYAAILPFFDGMGDLYQLVDVVVGRAGAISLSECMAYNRPMMMVPYPHAKDDHQLHNARWASALGFGSIVLQEDLPILSEGVLTTLFEKRGSGASAIDHVGAADRIIREIDALLS